MPKICYTPSCVMLCTVHEPVIFIYLLNSCHINKAKPRYEDLTDCESHTFPFMKC